MICRKCGKDFVENRDVYPPNICPECKGKTYTCTLHRPEEQNYGGGRAQRTSTRNQEAPKIVVCNREFSGKTLDPTEGPPGLENCPRCRDAYVCHSCHKTEAQVRRDNRWDRNNSGLELQACSDCSLPKSFCHYCKGNHRGNTCKRPSLKVPPSSFDAVQFTPLAKSVVSCSQSVQKKPLYFDNTQYINPALASTGAKTEFNVIEARKFAGKIFNTLVNFIIGNEAPRTEFHLPNSQNTMAIALLENDEHFKIILTYSDYDKTHVATMIKEDHGTFKLMCVEADPPVYYDKSSRQHFLYDLKTPVVCDKYTSKTEGIPPAARHGMKDANRLFICSYPLDERNDHHAEMRAVMYAYKRKYKIVCLLPTKECCDKCHGKLTTADVIDTVPGFLQFNLQTMFENQLHDPGANEKFSIVRVAGGGNCLFSVLKFYGIEGLPNTEDEMRQFIANKIAASPLTNAGAIAARVAELNAYVDSHDLTAVAHVINRKIILYEANYGVTRWNHRTINGTAGNPIYILMRSAVDAPQAHYDALSKI